MWSQRCIYLLKLLSDISIETNRAGPYQIVSIGTVWSGYTLFADNSADGESRRRKQTTIVVFCAITVNGYKTELI